MYLKQIYFVFITFTVFQNVVDAKKSKRIKRPSNEAEDTTPQPNVVTYSTFGFKDVGSYDGFIPSSPDYVNYFNSFTQQDSTTRLYAPAFATAQDSSGFSVSDTSHNDQSFHIGMDQGRPQSSSSQFKQNPMNYYSSPNYDNVVSQSQNFMIREPFGPHINEEINIPVYGTKLNSRNKNDSVYSTDVYGNLSRDITNDKYSNIFEAQSKQESKKDALDDERSNNFHKHVSAPTTEIENLNQSPTKSSNLLFPKVIDFTKMKQHYPLEIDDSFSETAIKSNTYDQIHNENTYNKNYHETESSNPIATSEAINRDPDNDNLKSISKPNTYSNQEFSYNNFEDSKHKNYLRYGNMNDRLKKPWISNHYNNNFKNWKSPLESYRFSTDDSNVTYKNHLDEIKKPSNTNNDEIIPSSSNVIDTTNYQFLETDYTTLKKNPGNAHYDEDYNNIQAFNSQNKYKSNDYLNQFKNFYSTVPTTTSHWGNNLYNSIDLSPYKNLLQKPLYDEINDDVVHIPKKVLGKHNSNAQYFDSKQNDWSSHTKYRPFKIKQSNNLNMDTSNRFKSEEDLLGLRTHDTYRPSHLFNLKDFSSKENDYNKLMDKWRQSYWKAKYRNLLSSDNDYDSDSYGSETKPIHVPVPRPYPVEVPHPVIVPVPQPYPIRVTVPKPIAVPVVKELTIPIEKPVPYPVLKKVPYPIEKPVPVRVEKQVAVPVMKPYPVPVPQIRTVFHHTKPHEEIDSEIEMEEDDDYLPQPESSASRNRKPYLKKPRSTHHTRRPIRVYQDRNRRKWPTRRPTRLTQNNYRPIETQYTYPHKYYEVEFDDDNRSYDYSSNCRRTGNC